jgi:hypothetical protein
VSPDPCPWYAQHSIGIDLNYRTFKKLTTVAYPLGRKIIDITPPTVTSSQHGTLGIGVLATDPFPCERGIKSFRDSAMTNLVKLKRTFKLPAFAFDSLVVIDSMLPGSAVYIVADSAGNTVKHLVEYFPKPDTIAPFIPPSVSSSGEFIVGIRESRPWDRGIKSVTLQPGSLNIRFDSAVYVQRSLARAYLTVLNKKDSAFGCLIATDSAGNASTECMTWYGEAKDIYPPVFSQDPIAIPRIQLTGSITEQRPFDKGLRDITVTALKNTGGAKVSLASTALAFVSVTLLDSLQPAVARVAVSDSAGHLVIDSLVYTPESDTFEPSCTLTDSTKWIKQFQATELRSWDRGIKSVTVSAINNLVASPAQFASRSEATLQLTVIDTFRAASAIVTATDSVGRECSSQVAFAPADIIRLLPFISNPSSGRVDFGTIDAQTSISGSIQLTNPNPVSVTISRVRTTGDVTDITWLEKEPISFAAGESKTFNYSYSPQLLGSDIASFVYSNDTMDFASVALTGEARAHVQIRVGSVAFAQSNTIEELRISVGASPSPINIDSIGFSLKFNRDLLELKGLPELLCKVNGVDCSFSLQSNGEGDSVINFLLIRNPSKSVVTLSIDEPVIRLLFTSFLTTVTETPLEVINAFASQSSIVTSEPGVAKVGSVCGDSTVRTAMRGPLSLVLTSIQPNPATHSVIVSAVGSGVATLRITDASGSIVRATDVTLNGAPLHTIDVSKLANGSYQLSLEQSGFVVSRKFQVLR